MNLHAIVMGRGPLGRHNVFYPASAVSMFVGCFLLSGSMDIKAGGLPLLLGLMGVVQVYEALIIGLGLWLVLRRGLPRDARLLLVVEAAFLADGTMLAGEAAAHPRWGVAVAAAMLALAAVKIVVAVKVMEVRPGWRHVAAVGAALVVLAFMPIDLAAQARRGDVAPWSVYVWWWVVGAVMIGHGAATWRARGNGPPRCVAGVAMIWPAVRWAAVGVVYVSLAAHLVGLAWVHKVGFQWPFVSPVFLGLAVAWDRLARGSRAELHRGRVRRGQLTLPMLAVVLSLLPSRGLDVDWVWALSPLRLTLIGAAAVYTMLLLRDRLKLLAAVAGAMLGAALTGPTLGVILQRIGLFVERAWDMLMAMVPQTAWQWGVGAVGLAFVLLMAGAAISVIRTRPARGAAETEG